MRVLACHSYYQRRGGEDCSFEQESDLLASKGHEVIRFTRHNDEVDRLGPVALATKTIWNRAVYRELRQVIRRERPDVMHCTNTFPLLSPAIYYAARRERVPVVQSLRNYRLLCPKAQFVRDGRVCEDCLGKLIPWSALKHNCYRDSRLATLGVSSLLVTHRLLRTWERAVTLFYTQSEFAKQKLISGGLPPERIAVKPNFSPSGVRVGTGAGGYFVYVGRLSAEKGVASLLSAWKLLEGDVRLKIVGDGPQSELARAAAASDSRIEWLGARSMAEVLEIMADAACLVFPSVWYETFGRTIVEAFSVGTPAVVSRLGAMTELVTDGENGLLFKAGDPHDLADKIRLAARRLAENSSLRQAARASYERWYTPQRNYGLLMAIYRRAISLDAECSQPLGYAQETR